MKRLLFLGWGNDAIVEFLRKEWPGFSQCSSIIEFPAVLQAEQPRVVVTGFADLEAVRAVLVCIDKVSARIPLVVVSDQSLQGETRRAILEQLGERGTLLSPVDFTSLRATLRSWVQPSVDPALLDSAALARVYATGGRSLADKVVEGFLVGGPGLAARAKASFDEGALEQCIRYLESLVKQAGSVGAVDVAEAVEEILDELIEGGRVGPEQWLLLNKALASCLRVLGEQKKQDRTV